MTRQWSAAFVGGIEHDAVETGLGAARDEVEIERTVGEEHGDEANACSCHFGKRRQGRRRIAFEEAELDDVDAGRRHGAHRGGDGNGFERLVADGGAHRPPSGERRENGADGCVGQSAEGAGRRLLEVDDVGAARKCRERLRGRAHAGEEPGHPRSLVVVAP